jgi:hypothetical protein
MGADEHAVRAYIEQVPSPTRRRDAETLVELMGRVTGEPPRMWGKAIIGFGQYHYKYESGREGDAPAAGFSPRKAAITIHLPDGSAPTPTGSTSLDLTPQASAASISRTWRSWTSASSSGSSMSRTDHSRRAPTATGRASRRRSAEVAGVVLHGTRQGWSRDRQHRRGER